MVQQEKILLYGFAAFSVLSSFLCVFYAVNVNFSPSASQWLKGFAYVAGGYGLFNVYILSWAWRSQSQWALNANLLIAVCFFAIFVLDTVKDGLQNPASELGSLIGLAAVLAINWQAVKQACRREGA